MQGEEQIGPYTGEQLAEYAGNGSIIRETLVWADGMENWLPAEQIENLFPPMAAPVQAAAGPVMMTTANPYAGAMGTTAANPYATPAQMGTAPPSDGSYPPVSVKAASYGMWLGMFIGGAALALVALIGIGATSNSTRDNSALIGILMGVGGIGYILYIIGSVLTYIYIFRAWKCLEFGGFARTTPGKAIGFMFIPFFNIYWLFQAINGLAKDWNTTMGAYQELQLAPRMSEGVFLTFCICTLVFPPVCLVLIFIIMSQLCKGINSFAFRPNQMGGALTGSFRLGG